MFGKALFHVNADENGFFVDRRIANFLEEQANTTILRAFEIEAFNSKDSFAISQKSHTPDGVIEEYTQKVEKCEGEGYIKLAEIFRSIAESNKLQFERD